MNVRVEKQENKIKKVDFGQHIVGYRFGPYYQRNYPTSATASTKHYEELLTRPNTGRQQKKIYCNFPSRLQADDQEEIQVGNIQFQPQKQTIEVAKDQEEQKHLEFVRSYQGWLNDNYIDEYRTSGMHTSFGMKKGRPSSRPKSSRNVPDIAVVQNYQWKQKQFKEWNLFPTRDAQSLRKKKVKERKVTPKPNRYKSEAELKLKILKILPKKELKEPRKTFQHKVVSRPSTTFLRTFSNPRILSIENRQLVTGTKITLH